MCCFDNVSFNGSITNTNFAAKFVFVKKAVKTGGNSSNLYKEVVVE